ncbi:hypothetical protein D3C80_1735160 [compost metagenome]
MGAGQVFHVELAGSTLLGDEVDAPANQFAEVLTAVRDPFDVVVSGNHAVELHAVALTEQ